MRRVVLVLLVFLLVVAVAPRIAVIRAQAGKRVQ